MDEVTAETAQAQPTATVSRTIPVIDGIEFFTVFAEDATLLPNENVCRELTAAALRYQDETRRNAPGFVMASLTSGVIGSAGWAAAKGGYTALRTYWERRVGQQQRPDAAAVLNLVRKTCLSTLGRVPDHFDETDLEHTDDGGWRIELHIDASIITARVDEYGQILHWRQHHSE